MNGMCLLSASVIVFQNECMTHIQLPVLVCVPLSSKS